MLDVLKRMAARNFAGGLRQQEKVGILTWIVGISELIQAEIDGEARPRSASGGRGAARMAGLGATRASASARFPQVLRPTTPRSSRRGRHRRRATRSCQRRSCASSPTGQASLSYTTRSWRSRTTFEAIAVWHTDVAKPYRRADNLRFWTMAARRRWDVDLAAGEQQGGFDVNELVLNETPAAWRRFDAALLRWCRAVREELQAELEEPREGEVPVGRRAPAPAPPRLLVEPGPASLLESSAAAAGRLTAQEGQAEAGASEAASL